MQISQGQYVVTYKGATSPPYSAFKYAVKDMLVNGLYNTASTIIGCERAWSFHSAVVWAQQSGYLDTDGIWTDELGSRATILSSGSPPLILPPSPIFNPS